MTEQTMRNEFLTVYDKCADDIFAYCYERIAHREVARYLTRNIFMRTWDLVSTKGPSVNIEKTLYSTAKDHVKDFKTSQEQDVTYSKNLWNLTLSQ